jgi:hypothetical protein
MPDTVSKSFNSPVNTVVYFIREELYQKIKQYTPELQSRLINFGSNSKNCDFITAVFQRRLYYSTHFIPFFSLTGKLKFFRENILSTADTAMNLYFKFRQRILPERRVLYLNNIILVQKS